MASGSIQQQSFATILTNAATAIQGAASQLVDMSVGAVLRAAAESWSLTALWLQGIGLQIAALTRFATSTGADADSWAADYDFYRLPAQAATGQVSIGRLTATSQAQITAAVQSGTDANGNPIWDSTNATIVQTQDGTEQYTVIPDTEQPFFQTALNAYVIPPGVAFATASISALVAGASGNVAANMISALGSAIPGVDTVTNPTPLTNGADAESDPAFKARFVTYIANLSKGTPGAIENAILGLRQDTYCNVVENTAYNGTPQPGYFYVVVDDGTGNPSSNFLASAANAAEATRPIGATYGIFPPVLVSANVTMSLGLAPGYDRSTVDGIVTAALTTYENTLDIGETLPYTRLPQIAYDASPGVTNVTGVTLNGVQADLVATAAQVIRAGTFAVN